jgi:hypothetical protein
MHENHELGSVRVLDQNDIPGVRAWNVCFTCGTFLQERPMTRCGQPCQDGHACQRMLFIPELVCGHHTPAQLEHRRISAEQRQSPVKHATDSRPDSPKCAALKNDGTHCKSHRRKDGSMLCMFHYAKALRNGADFSFLGSQ